MLGLAEYYIVIAKLKLCVLFPKGCVEATD